MEQLNGARVTLANILDVLTSTTSPNESVALNNQALHEALAPLQGENERFEVMKAADPRFADIEEWITAEIERSVGLIASRCTAQVQSI